MNFLLLYMMLNFYLIIYFDSLIIEKINESRNIKSNLFFYEQIIL